MAFRISKLISLRPSSSRPPCFSSVRNISVARSPNHRHHHPSTRNIVVSSTNLLPIHHNQQQQVRYHRTDYEGPGKYGERETGSMFGEQHDHSHEHQDITHHQNKKDVINEGEKEQLQQLLKVRYNRRSGSYSHRGYTIGIGGPGKDILLVSPQTYRIVSAID